MNEQKDERNEKDEEQEPKTSIAVLILIMGIVVASIILFLVGLSRGS